MELKENLKDFKIHTIDAMSKKTPYDYMDKIWYQIYSVGIGIAIITDKTPPQTLCNIFYELGIMQNSGKTTFIIKTDGIDIPSDFSRTEYIQYKTKDFKHETVEIARMVSEVADYKHILAESYEADPEFAIEYFISAFLLSGKSCDYKAVKATYIKNKHQFSPSKKDFIEHFISKANPRKK